MRIRRRRRPSLWLMFKALRNRKRMTRYRALVVARRAK
jgi:hypothetical protein